MEALSALGDWGKGVVWNKCSFLKTQKVLEQQQKKNSAGLTSGPSSFHCRLSTSGSLPACPRFLELFNHLYYSLHPQQPLEITPKYLG